MYSIKVRAGFNSAHNLRHYRGKCERLHGHNWNVEVTFSSATVNAQGMVLDFKIAKEKLNAIISKLDHHYLNDMPYFRKCNPSSENIARYIYEKMQRACVKTGASLREVTVWETETSCAVYSGRTQCRS